VKTTRGKFNFKEGVKTLAETMKSIIIKGIKPTLLLMRRIVFVYILSIAI